MHLTHIVTALADSLNGELLQRHLATDDDLQGTDGGIYRTVTAGTGLELLVGNEQTHAGHTLHALAGCHLQIVELDVVSSRAVGTGQHENVVVCHLLLLVGQLQELLVHLIQLLSIQFHTVHTEAMAQSGTSATGSQYDGVIIDTHLLGIHNLVSRYILQHAILMDTAGVCEGILAHDGLVGLHRHVHQRADHTAGGVNLLRIDVCLDTQVRMRLEYHCNLFERGVSCPLADAVDGHLHLARSVEHTSHGIGRSHA